jgi:DNA gyrase subunit A
MNITEKTGKLVAIKDVDDNNDIMIINKSGITIRLAMKDLRVLGRVTQGVRLINIGDKDEIASVAKIDVIEGEEDEILGEDGTVIEGTIDTTSESEAPETTTETETPPAE